jgi:hypothetical protein
MDTSEGYRDVDADDRLLDGGKEVQGRRLGS